MMRIQGEKIGTNRLLANQGEEIEGRMHDCCLVIAS